MGDPAQSLFFELHKFAVELAKDLDEGDVLPAREFESIADRALRDLAIEQRSRIATLSDAPESCKSAMKFEIENLVTSMTSKALCFMVKRALRQGIL